MKNLTLVLGGPGCGKTTRLLEIVTREFAAGVAPSEVAFVAFTRAAAEEARARAGEKFGLDPVTDLPWFRTIHSLVYAQMGMSHDELMMPRDWREFGRIIGETMTAGGNGGPEGMPGVAMGAGERGALMLRIIDYASTTCQSLYEAWHQLDHPIDWFQLKRTSEALAEYKVNRGKSDFTDMLHDYLSFAQPMKGIRVAIIDEAQDLTPAQWKAVRWAFRDVERVYVGGDDDQAIYRWAGADVDHFLGLLPDHEEVLPLSHRLTAPIWTLAQGIVRRIGHRFAKDYQPDPSRPGRISHYRDPGDVDLSSGTWLLLARNGYFLSDLAGMCERAGYPYRTRSGSAVVPDEVAAMKLWSRLASGKASEAGADDFRALAALLDRPKPSLRDTATYGPGDFPEWPWGKPWYIAMTGIPVGRRDYYVACLRRGESLSREPRIRIETIHGVKGAEADHVLLLTDISARTHASAQQDPDNEHRVFYVGVTRARESLHLIGAQTPLSYDV